MEHLFNVYKILVFISFAFYSIMGGLTISLNSKATENRIFGVICTALVFWVSGALLSTVAPDIEAALFWRRISAIGWGTLYSFLFHFFLVLSGEKKLLKKIWLYFIIYLPAAVNILVFCILSITAENQFHLYMTELGWVNIPGSSLWDTFFNIYYLSFSIAVIAILIRWGFRTNRDRKKQATGILIAYLTAIILGSISDIFLSKFIYVRIPSLAPFFIAIPMVAVYYEIKKFSLMKADLKSEIADSGLILSQAGQVRVYSYLSLLFILISLITFILYLIIDTAGIENLLFSLVTFLIGSTIRYLPAIFNNTFHRDNIMIPTMNISVLLIMIHVSDLSFDQHMWPFPVFIMLVSIIFNKVYLLLSVASTAITANLLLWYREEIPFDFSLVPEYMPRVLFFIIAAYLAINIRKLYLERLRVNEVQVLFQRMISNVSSKLVTINEDNIDERLTAVLKDFGSFYHVDHVGLIIFNENELGIAESFEWSPEDQGCRLKLLKNYLNDDYPWFVEQFFSNEIVSVYDIDQLPEQVDKLRRSLQDNLIKCHIAIPIFSEGRLEGVLVLNFTTINALRITNDTEKMLRIPANLIADGLMKIDSQKKINRLAYFDALTGLPNRTLFQDRLDSAIALAARNKKLVAVMMT